MMIEIRDANEFHQIVKSDSPVYYRDPEYRSNFRRIEPENGIRSMNPFTYPNETFYRMVDEKEAEEMIFNEVNSEAEKEQSYSGKWPSNQEFFKAGWEGAKAYFKFTGEQE